MSISHHALQSLLHQLDRRLSTPVRALIASAAMPVIMYDWNTTNNLSFDPRTALPRRPKPYAMPNDVEMLNTSFPTRQLWAEIYTPRHDPDSQVRIEL